MSYDLGYLYFGLEKNTEIISYTSTDYYREGVAMKMVPRE